jgi:hypothetical protein
MKVSLRILRIVVVGFELAVPLTMLALAGLLVYMGLTGGWG